MLESRNIITCTGRLNPAKSAAMAKRLPMENNMNRILLVATSTDTDTTVIKSQSQRYSI